MADELGHLLRQMGQQASHDYKPHVYGHIAAYDPVKHRVRCIVPSIAEDDGTPLLSPWMPMGTLSAGDGYGIQVIYKGGASATNPTAGEQVLIGLFDKYRGVAAVPCMFYHGSSPPPATNLPKKDQGWENDAGSYQAGDVIISGPPTAKGKANSVVRIRGGGDIEIWGSTTLTANVMGDINATTKNGNVAVSASTGDVNVTSAASNVTVSAKGTIWLTAAAVKFGKAVSDTLQQLCTTALHDWAATHVHQNTGPPTTQPPSNSLTSTMTAE